MIRRIASGFAAFAAALLAAACGRGEAGAPTRFEYAEPHMGTEVRLVLYAPDRTVADLAAADAFRTVARLDSLFSDYRPDSEVARLSGSAGSGEPLTVSPETLDLLLVAQSWAARTGGAFDVTVGPLTRLWRQAMRDGALPDDERLARARAASGYDGLVVDSARGSVALTRPGMALDLGGIAKGYAAQAVLEELASGGVPVALVDAGGDLALGDPPPGEDGWRVQFPGGEVHRMSGVAVATSGDRYQYLEVGGIRYSHILDPRTGIGIAASPTVAVVASDATTADVLASALTILSPEEGRALVEKIPGLAVRVTWPDDRSGSWETVGFPLPPHRRLDEERIP